MEPDPADSPFGPPKMGPKWSFLGSKMVDFSDFRHQIGSQIGHFGGPKWPILGVPTAPRSLGTPYLVAVYPPNMPIWAIWALLAIWVGNGVFYPFSVHFDQMGQNMTVRRSTGHGPNW